MASSLFLVGEIGGNDYNQALFQGRSFDEVKPTSPTSSPASALQSLYVMTPNKTTQNYFTGVVSTNPATIDPCSCRFAGTDRARRPDSGSARELPDRVQPG